MDKTVDFFMDTYMYNTTMTIVQLPEIREEAPSYVWTVVMEGRKAVMLPGFHEENAAVIGYVFADEPWNMYDDDMRIVLDS